MTMPTKTVRRKLARDVNREVKRYLDLLTPSMEQYCRDNKHNVDAHRRTALHNAQVSLQWLIDLEQDIA